MDSLKCTRGSNLDLNVIVIASDDNDKYLTQFSVENADLCSEVKKSTINHDPSTSTSCQILPEFSLTTKDKMNLMNILNEWKLGYLYQTCVDECVDIQSLYYINTYQISQLLSNYAIGIQIKFEHCIKEWRKKERKSESVEPLSAHLG